jgi:hypothetical protein
MRVVPSDVVKLIEKIWPDLYARTDPHLTLNYSYRPHLQAIVEMYDRIPDDLLAPPRDEYPTLMAAVGGIRAAIVQFNIAGDSRTIDKTPGLGNVDPVTALRSVLQKCPDEVAGQAATDRLAFLADEDLQRDLALDVASAHRSVTAGDWKAATVVAGSVVEALLLWRLQKHDPTPLGAAVTKLKLKPSPDQWDLGEQIRVCEELGILKPETHELAEITRKFRNLIHPGRAIRLAQACDKGTALAALAAVERVIVDVS